MHYNVFLSCAHATGLETEMLSYAEAQAMSRRLRKAGKAISNQPMFNEVRSRDRDIEEQQRRKAKRLVQNATLKETHQEITSPAAIATAAFGEDESVADDAPPIVVPDVRVIDYEAAKQEFEMW